MEDVLGHRVGFHTMAAAFQQADGRQLSLLVGRLCELSPIVLYELASSQYASKALTDLAKLVEAQDKDRLSRALLPLRENLLESEGARTAAALTYFLGTDRL